MKASSIAIALIWVIFLFDAFRQGRKVPVSAVAQQIRLDWFGQVALFLPFVFFLFAAFFQRHKQFSYPLVTRAVDGKLGPGTFAGFISRLRPVTLFMLACLTLGTTGLLSTYLTTQEIGGYIVSGFFTSAGLGLLVAYLLSIKFPPKLA